MVLNKANPRTGLSARPVGCLLFKRSRHLPIFTGRFQPTIFGTSELNFCVRNGNRWFLIPGYTFAIAISLIVPKLFTAIAFDAGGVASGPMTATFLLPLAQGACVAVGGNIVTDAFGVVAMVAMTPLITVQLMGLIAELKTRKTRKAQPAFALAAAYAELPDDAIIEL